jgi:hypothetical protein
MASDLIWKSNNYLINHNNTHSTAASRHSQNSQQEVINGGSQFMVSVSDCSKTIAVDFMDNAKVSMKKKSKASTACEALFEKGVYNEQLRFFVDLFIKAMKDSWDDISNCVILPFMIECFTKIKVVANNVSQIYRGHPAYRGEDPWHDWVNVSWKLLNRRLRNVPAQIIFFVDVNYQQCPYAETINEFRGEGTYAAIHSMKDKPNAVRSSQLLTHGIHETLDFKDVFHFQKVDSFANPAFVVNNIGCPNHSLFVIRPMSEWAKEFL